MKRFVLLIVVFCLLVMVTGVSALTILKRTVEESMKDADAIVVGRVEQIRKLNDPDGQFIDGLDYNEISIRVTEVVKGDVPELISVLKWRGELERYTPGLSRQENVLLCLSESKAGKYTILGLKYGKFNVDQERVNDTNISLPEFKRQIHELLSGKRSGVSDEVKPGHSARLAKEVAYFDSAFVLKSTSVYTGSPPGYTFKYNPANAHPDTANNVKSLIGEAFSVWNSVTSSDLVINISSEETSTGYNNLDSEHVIVWGDIAQAGVVAQAHWCGDGADIMIDTDDRDWHFSTSTSMGQYDTDFISIILHEAGYTFDVHHCGYDYTQHVMYAENVRGTQKRELADGDLGAITYLYTVLDFSGNSGNVYDYTQWSVRATLTFQGNISVPSGAELRVKKPFIGTDTFNLNGYSLLESTGGTITHDYGSGFGTIVWNPDIRLTGKPDNRYGTIQAAVTDGEVGDTVLVKTADTYTEGIALKNGVHLINDSGGTVTLQSAGGIAMVADQDDDLTVKGFRFTGSTTWSIHVEETTGVTFEDCEISMNGWEGFVILDSGDMTCDDVQVSNSGGDGFFLSGDGCDPRIKNCNIWNNGDYGVYCQLESTPNLYGYQNPNDFSGNSDEDIYATSNCGNINATYNRWNETPDVTHTGSPTYSIDTSNATVYKPAVIADSRTRQARMLNAQGRALVAEGEDEEALMRFKQVVDQYPDTETARFALAHASSVYWRQKRFGDAVAYLEGVARLHANIGLGVKAEYISLRHQSRLGDYEGILARVDAILARHPESEYVPYAMLRRGRVYLKLDDPVQAAGVFEDVRNTYPEHEGIQKLVRGYLAIARERAGLPRELAAKPSPAVAETALLKNFPNPFNPTTTLSFALTEPAPVQLVIYNTVGQKVRTLATGTEMGAGTHQVVWDGKDEQGRPVSSGIYLYEMKAGGFQAVRKMIMLK